MNIDARLWEEVGIAVVGAAIAYILGVEEVIDEEHEVELGMEVFEGSFGEWDVVIEFEVGGGVGVDDAGAGLLVVGVLLTDEVGEEGDVETEEGEEEFVIGDPVGRVGDGSPAVSFVVPAVYGVAEVGVPLQPFGPFDRAEEFDAGAEGAFDVLGEEGPLAVHGTGADELVAITHVIEVGAE